MAEPQLLTYIDNPGSTPATFVLPAGMAIRLNSVVATFNGAGAAGAFLPCLAVYSQDDKLIGRFHPSGQLAAGDTGVVTFAPFLGQDILDAVGKPICQVTLGFGADPPQSIANDTSTLISWGVQVADTAAMFDPGSPTLITITEAGWYAFSGSIEFSASITGYRRVELRRNDTTNSGIVINAASPTAGITWGCTINSAGQYAVGETMVVRVRQNAGGPLNASGGLTVYKFANPT